MNSDEPQDAVIAQAEKMLKHAKDVSRRIQERVKDALKDTDELKALENPTGEHNPASDGTN